MGGSLGFVYNSREIIMKTTYLTESFTFYNYELDKCINDTIRHYSTYALMKTETIPVGDKKTTVIFYFKKDE